MDCAKQFLFGLFVSAIMVVLPSISCAKEIAVPEQHKTIQAALDAASTGDIILVDPGTYHERLVLKRGITLKSAGDDTRGKLGLLRAEKTIINGGGKQDGGPGVELAEKAVLDGFTITNVGFYDDAKWKKHHASQGNLQSHEHIGAPGVAGIAVTGISTCTVINNIVHHIGYTGIAIIGDPNKQVSPRVVRNFSYRNMGGGIGSMKKSTAIISENTCFENFYAGIGHDDASPLVTKNICYSNIRAGIGVSEGACPIVQGNRCYKNRRAGIGIRAGSMTKPVIEDNDCYQNDMSGIGNEEHVEPTIRNNRCYENKLAGIGSRDHARPKIINNRCYRNLDAGIGTEGAAVALIEGNECYENARAGIGQRGDAQTTLIGNHCHHNKTTGIGFDACKIGQATMRDNKIIDNTLVAVGIHAGWTVHLSNNILSRKGGLPPIAMVFKGATATFDNNTIQGEGVAGIRVGGVVVATGNRFAGITIRKAGPPNYGVWALAGSKVTLSHNHFTTWRHALVATEASVTANRNTIRNFHKTALIITNAPQGANVFDNTAISQNTQDQVVVIQGRQAKVTNNVLQTEPK
jgi:parallel beta-helix repeat protein